jgi:hypothetical protein
MMVLDIDEGLSFVRKNIDALAEIADQNFIDPQVRPKEKRQLWTAKSYHEAVLAGMDWWSKQNDATKRRYLHSVKDYTVQALQHEFPEERARWIYSILVARPDERQEQADREKEALRKELRLSQAKMNPLDANIRCLDCGKFIHMYDETNNKRHERAEVCECTSSHTLQAEMAERVGAYRKHLELRKRQKEAKSKR